VNDNFVYHRLWEILFPSVTLKYFVQYFVYFFDRILSYSNFYNILHGAYDVRINKDAHEEAIMSMHGLTGDVYIECHAVGFYWDLHQKYNGLGDNTFWRRYHIRLLHLLLKRQIYWTNKTQVIAKSPSMTWCIQECIDEFPDCKIICIARHPYDMLCSNLALLDSTFNVLYGKDCVEFNWFDLSKHLIWRRFEQWRRTLLLIKKKKGKKKNK